MPRAESWLSEGVLQVFCADATQNKVEVGYEAEAESEYIIGIG